jgi:hypothetical protein
MDELPEWLKNKINLEVSMAILKELPQADINTPWQSRMDEAIVCALIDSGLCEPPAGTFWFKRAPRSKL